MYLYTTRTPSRIELAGRRGSGDWMGMGDLQEALVMGIRCLFVGINRKSASASLVTYGLETATG